MPLEKGSSDETVSKNVSMLMKEGKTREEALAIALGEAGRSKGDSLSVQRYDRVQLQSPEKTNEGFLKGDAFLTRSGILEYATADGMIRELRPEQAVFDSASLDSLRMKPVTDDHPAVGGRRVMVTTDNISQFSKGSVGENLERVDGKIKARIMITDSDMVKAVLAGRNQLSCGYVCSLKFEGGTFDGQHFDAIQSNIVYNHVAVVSEGRAGPDVAMRIDSAETGLDNTFDNLECNGDKYGRLPVYRTSKIHILKPAL